MGKLTARGVESLAKRKGRYGDGDGLFLRVLDPSKRVYWTFRYRANGRDREMSIGPYPELSLAEARARHVALRKAVVTDKIDPIGDRRAAKSMSMLAQVSAKPTFGVMAIDHVETHEFGWRSAKYGRQWRQTLTQFCQKGHLQRLLPKPKKLTHGHHAAMPYDQLASFMARLTEIDNLSAKALRLTILTACRTSEVLGMTWDEVDIPNAVWRVPASRMKMGVEHAVPLSDQAVAILRAQEAVGRSQNPHVLKPLSSMSMSMLLRRLNAPVTVHGMRASFRMWAADTGVPFEVAESCLAHTTGGVVAAYQRSSMLERRRPIMSAWASFLSGEADDDVVIPFRQARP